MTRSIVTADETQAQIVEIFAEELEIDAAEMELNGHFVDDYDGDSLALIAVMARIEKELGVAIPKSELVNMVDLEHVFEIVDGIKAARA